MRSQSSWSCSLTALLFAAIVPACGPQDGSDLPENDELSVAHSAASLTSLTPPPSSCNQRHAGVTGIQVQIRIDEYQGLIKGRNGTHEIAYGTIVSTPWVYDSKIVDTSNAELALNVKSAKDPTGLPYEVKLAVGSVYEVQGEYIPAATASAHDKKGAAAVIHFSHAPCGYVSVGGTVYR
jgi:hypothetical protein